MLPKENADLKTKMTDNWDVSVVRYVRHIDINEREGQKKEKEPAWTKPAVFPEKNRSLPLKQVQCPANHIRAVAVCGAVHSAGPCSLQFSQFMKSHTRQARRPPAQEICSFCSWWAKKVSDTRNISQKSDPQRAVLHTSWGRCSLCGPSPHPPGQASLFCMTPVAISMLKALAYSLVESLANFLRKEGCLWPPPHPGQFTRLHRAFICIRKRPCFLWEAAAPHQPHQSSR